MTTTPAPDVNQHATERPPTLHTRPLDGPTAAETLPPVHLDHWAINRLTEAWNRKAQPMTAVGFHFITVTEDSGTADARFTCTAGPTDDCHMYPDCECEAWEWADPITHVDTAGHERNPHAQCWAQDWFDNGGHQYDGPDRDPSTNYYLPVVPRTGPVTIAFNGDYVEWNWTRVS